MSDPNSHLNKSFRMQKTALIFIVLALCVVGRGKRLWPFINWTMYSLRTMHYPEDSVSSLELRVEGSSGDLITLTPWDLIPKDRDIVAYKIINRSISDNSIRARDKCRAYLSQLVKLVRPGITPKTIQIWEITWHVDPLALPPLNLKKPTKEIMKVSFPITMKAREGKIAL